LTNISSSAAFNRVNLYEYLKDQDPLRKGFMPRGRLAGGLARAGIRLSECEVQALSDRYVVRNQVDVSKKALVRWRDMLDEINGVFTVKNLQVSSSSSSSSSNGGSSSSSSSSSRTRWQPVL